MEQLITKEAIDFKARDQQEKDSRPERLEKLSQEVDSLFPGEELAELRQEIIERSFNVPQFGKYHNEGMLMDTHLGLMLDRLEQLKRGEFFPQVSRDVQQMIQSVIDRNEKSLKKYVFLHDIAKADCLSYTLSGQKTKQRTTLETLLQDIPEKVRLDPTALRIYFAEHNIESISYNHPRDKKHNFESKKHGEEGRKKLEQIAPELQVPELLLLAIERHEVAFSFDKANIRTFEKHFGSLDEEQLTWILTASFLDTGASLREDIKPDFTNFLRVVDSKYNAEVFRQLEDRLRPDGKPAIGLDLKKINEELIKLKDWPKKFDGTPTEFIERIYHKCQRTTYNKQALAEYLGLLVESEEIDIVLMRTILNAIDDKTGVLDQKKINLLRRKLGEKNRLLNVALKNSVIK